MMEDGLDESIEGKGYEPLTREQVENKIKDLAFYRSDTPCFQGISTAISCNDATLRAQLHAQTERAEQAEHTLMDTFSKIDDLKGKLNEAVGALGYPVPDDTPIPRYNNGIAEALHRQVTDITAKLAAIEQERDLAKQSKNQCVIDLYRNLDEKDVQLSASEQRFTDAENERIEWVRRGERAEEQLADITRQVANLAAWIMAHVPGEPSQDQGACEAAISIMSRWQATIAWKVIAEEKEKELAASEQRVNELKEAEKSTAFRHYDTISEIQQTARDIVKESEQRVKSLENDLADALDLKNGVGPTVLTALATERDQLQATVTRLEAIKTPDDAFTYCAYCGFKSPVDENGEDIAAHIRTCEKHPMRVMELDYDRRMTELRNTVTAQAEEIGRLREALMKIANLEHGADNLHDLIRAENMARQALASEKEAG